MTTHLAPRRRFAAGILAVGATLLAFGVLASPAEATPDPEPAVFGPGYDSYLNANQRGISYDAVENKEDCPADAKVAGLTAWHFVMSASTHDFASLDVAFTLGGSDITLSDLTPRSTSGWASFDPTKNFIFDPTGKHAYVYTDGTGLVRDAAAQDDPDTEGPKFQLSHVCVGEGGGTDGSTDGGTTDTGTTDTGGTDEVLSTDSVQTTTDTGTTDQPGTEVEGETITPGAAQQLPRTGDNDRSLAILGAGLVLAGAGLRLMSRERAARR